MDDLGGVVAQHAECIGRATNNEAEYRALISGIEAAAHHGSGHLTCVSDSELLIRQLQGNYRVKKRHLKLLHRRAIEAAEAFDQVFYEHRPRSDPQIAKADAMVNEALDLAKSGDADCPSPGVH